MPLAVIGEVLFQFDSICLDSRDSVLYQINFCALFWIYKLYYLKKGEKENNFCTYEVTIAFYSDIVFSVNLSYFLVTLIKYKTNSCFSGTHDLILIKSPNLDNSWFCLSKIYTKLVKNPLKFFFEIFLDSFWKITRISFFTLSKGRW